MNDAAPLARRRHEPADRAGPVASKKIDGTRTPTTAAAAGLGDSSDGGDIDSMVATMQQSARQLDEMLQRMCATTAVIPTGDTDESDTDDSEELRPVGPLAVESAARTSQAYFDAIRWSFSRDQRTGVRRVGGHALSRLLTSGDADVSSTLDDKTFLASTADVTYMFPVSTTAMSAMHHDDDTDEWDMAEALTLRAFHRRIVESLASTDRAMPSAVADAMATTMAQHVVQFSRADCELKAIGAVFPIAAVQSDTHVEWRRGNRICKVLAVQRRRRRQWGVELTLTLETVARAQGTSPSAGSDEGGAARLGPPLSCVVECRTFVPKTAYEATTDGAVAVKTALLLSLSAEGDRSADSDETVSTGGADATPLPEFLNVYHWGGHAELLPSDESSMTAPASFDASTEFQLLHVQAPLPRNRIVQAACGRLHTLLLNDVGLVFSYGHAMDGALGHGEALRRTDVVLPQPKLIDFFLQSAVPVQSVACGGDDLTGFHSAAVARNGSVYTWGVGVALGLGSVKSKSSPTRVAIPSSSAAMTSIACGSGFCVALNADGAAFAWGKWSDGRLGLGAIPMLHRSPSSSNLHRPRRQLQRFQLYPKAISSSTRWRKVSCGDAHCVALSRGGLVYVWGRGRQGQLGLGDVRDAMAPVVLLPKKKAWRDVAAGHDWSMAVDARGAVWSWGACGAAVLGLSQGDDADRHAIVADVLLQKHVQLRQQPHGNKPVGLTPPPRFHWLRPQPIPSLAHRDAAIQSISAGVRHAAAVSERGDLYVWGCPQQGLSPHPALVTGTSMGATIAERVFCGGSHVVALTSGSFLARAMQRLHQTLQARLDETATPSPPAAADAVLLVGGGHALYAHRLVLARRSPVLRDLLRSEERPSDTEPTAVVTEVLLPQLRVEIARVVLEFLYTDNITTALDPLSYLIRDVLRWARELKIPRLVGICRERIASVSYVPLLDDYRKDTEAEEEDNDGELMRGHSLTDDLAVAFGDATYADLHIVAEHRAIPVHRCLLLARSQYFRALLAFYDQPHAAARSPIVVDESYAGMVRVLHFIYHDELTTVDKTGQFPGQEASDFAVEEDEPMEQVLEDLIAADKYGLVRMKRLCEHRIRVTTTNCLDVLVVADLVHADHLKHVALTFLHANLHVLNDTVLPRLAHEFPHLLTELYDRLHRHTQQQTLLRDWQRAVELDAHKQQQRQLEQWQQARKETAPQGFPWVPLMLALVFAVLYLSIMHAREYDYAIVPAVNLVVVGGLLAAAFLGKI